MSRSSSPSLSPPKSVSRDTKVAELLKRLRKPPQFGSVLDHQTITTPQFEKIVDATPLKRSRRSSSLPSSPSEPAVSFSPIRSPSDSSDVDESLHQQSTPIDKKSKSIKRRYRIPSRLSSTLSGSRVEIYHPRVTSTNQADPEERSSHRHSLVKFVEEAKTSERHPVNLWPGMTVLIPDASGRVRVLGDPETLASISNPGTNPGRGPHFFSISFLLNFVLNSNRGK
ncbi:hypothetical protein RCL1_008777 [Eukaryota sp. TZLM3-RCL]